jgi:quercetin dioxygenase-like cupin family protein
VATRDTIFVLEGSGTVQDYTNGVELEFHAGCIVSLPIAVKHAVKASRGVEVVSVGGPTPADIPMLKRLGVLPSI